MSRARNSEGGFTIIELMVTIFLLSIVSATFLAATNTIYGGVHKQQGIDNVADGNRRALTVFDKQVRYATGINAPGTASDGNFYIEYQWNKSNGSTDTATCTQWRLNPTTDILQYRSWTSGTTPSPTPTWTTATTGVINDPVANPPFVLAAPPTGVSTNVLLYQQLTVTLQGKRDTGSFTTTSTYTALDSSSTSAPSPAICQEVARS